MGYWEIQKQESSWLNLVEWEQRKLVKLWVLRKANDVVMYISMDSMIWKEIL